MGVLDEWQFYYELHDKPAFDSRVQFHIFIRMVKHRFNNFIWRVFGE